MNVLSSLVSFDATWALDTSGIFPKVFPKSLGISRAKIGPKVDVTRQKISVASAETLPGIEFGFMLQVMWQVLLQIIWQVMWQVMLQVIWKVMLQLPTCTRIRTGVLVLNECCLKKYI